MRIDAVVPAVVPIAVSSGLPEAPPQTQSTDAGPSATTLPNNSGVGSQSLPFHKNTVAGPQSSLLPKSPGAGTGTDRWEPSQTKPANEVQYTFDRTARETVQQVVDPTTQKIISEIPSEQMRQLTESLTKIVEHELDRRA